MVDRLTEDYPVDFAPREASTPAESGVRARGRIVVNPRRAILCALGVLSSAFILSRFYNYVTEDRFFVSTDDAYVRADISTLAAKVSGYIAAVNVVENQRVTANEVIATIDPVDYRLAVDAAQKKLKTQRLTIGRIDHQIEGQSSLIAQAVAQLSAAEAEARRAVDELRRVQQLLYRGYATRQRFEQAQADEARAGANVSAARAAVSYARMNERILRDQKTEAQAVHEELSVALAKSEQDFVATQVRSPFDGVIGNKAVHVGQFVQPGTRLFAVVSTNDAYVEANFKETQLQDIKLDQEARIALDALPGERIAGRVESIAPATGSQFSLLPPENATGNFTKIVQRVPVRIAVSSRVAADFLRPGMSVRVDVDTRARKAEDVLKTESRYARTAR